MINRWTLVMAGLACLCLAFGQRTAVPSYEENWHVTVQTNSTVVVSYMSSNVLHDSVLIYAREGKIEVRHQIPEWAQAGSSSLTLTNSTGQR